MRRDIPEEDFLPILIFYSVLRNSTTELWGYLFIRYALKVTSRPFIVTPYMTGFLFLSGTHACVVIVVVVVVVVVVVNCNMP